MKKPELLAPAGDFEKLKIAIAYGADAVYAGVSHFSLRCHSGKEFDYETFKEAVDYAHERGVKVYATVNSFPFENQLPIVEEHIKKLKEIGVDAMIISTLGVIMKAKEIAPEIDIHLSTQANALNSWDYKTYRDLGVKRIIAARETTLKDLIKIKEKVPEIEIEVFVHGAMCFAYSGRCLLSAVQFGRNPNKGSCANDCRYPYVLYAKNPETGMMFRLEEYPKDGTYIMNAKDLCLINHIPEIIDSGVVDSVKIEGRTKAPYYVAVVTKAYKDAIDEYINTKKCECDKYYQEILTTKNRGLTDAYLVKRPYERLDTQNLETSLTYGNFQVAGIVNEDGETFMCKYKILPGDVLEILLPKNAKITPCKNEIGEIFKDKKWYLRLDKIITKSGKELSSVHSGNLNPIKLPCKLPYLSFLRKEVDFSPNGV